MYFFNKINKAYLLYFQVFLEKFNKAEFQNLLYWIN